MKGGIINWTRELSSFPHFQGMPGYSLQVFGIQFWDAILKGLFVVSSGGDNYQIRQYSIEYIAQPR
jgi:hypothetical protein